MMARSLIKSNAVLLALCAFMATGSGVSAESSQAKRQYVTIPVLYVTDRAPTKKGYGPQRKDEDLSTIDDLHYGWLEYALKSDKTVSREQKLLGWIESQRSPENVLTMRRQTETASVQGFGQTIIDAAKKAGTNEVFVMVHGFNTPFARAANGAALLAQAVQRPVILYSWPSKGRLGQYGVDLGNNEWSQEHFDGLIDELVRVKQQSGIKFNLIAHSMGNRLAVHSAPVLKGRHVFQQMFLVDPDFDAETFVHYLYRYARKKDEPAAVTTKAEVVAINQSRVAVSPALDSAEKTDSPKLTDVDKSNVETSVPKEKSVDTDVSKMETMNSARSTRVDQSNLDSLNSDVKTDAAEAQSDVIEPTKVRILFSHKDRALPLSELIFGGYTRLGQAADSLLSSVTSPLSLPSKLGDALSSVVTKDATKSSGGSGTKGSNQPKWLMTFEWIDFTALDHGLIGHTIPYNLIASLWSTNGPGKGLMLVPSHNGSPNKMSSLFSHLFGEKDHISSKIVTAQRVVVSPKDGTSAHQ